MGLQMVTSRLPAMTLGTSIQGCSGMLIPNLNLNTIKIPRKIKIDDLAHLLKLVHTGHLKAFQFPNFILRYINWLRLPNLP